MRDDVAKIAASTSILILSWIVLYHSCRRASTVYFFELDSTTVIFMDKVPAMILPFVCSIVLYFVYLGTKRIEESPVRQSSVDNYDDENVYGEDDITISSATTSFVQNLENGTPRTKQSGPKGRRSQLFPSLQGCSNMMMNIINVFFVEEVLSGEEVSVVSTVVRRAPMLIAPSATPGGPSKPASRKAATPRFKKPSTPVVAPSCDPDEGGPSTVRRQRSAKMNIKSMKEPSTGSKLRRPGKHDEPMPYISSFY
ncbi:hypothetical protein CRE_10823 [Caenorhabditis remanei]|uniref:Uncharacterized protein n=1 Tax=Caenorhabditis remanei TaxID=31234 RepID=E3M522_CAERE|nr:hypothetical protein CRE_10823 [Caenorhabditis remanei]